MGLKHDMEEMKDDIQTAVKTLDRVVASRSWSTEERELLADILDESQALTRTAENLLDEISSDSEDR